MTKMEMNERKERYLKARGVFFDYIDKEFTKKEEKTWREEMDRLKGKNVYEDGVDTIYRYYFQNKNAIYVGRTIYPNMRDNQHRIRENDTVYKFAKENNEEIPKMEIIEEGLTILEGSEREKYWANHYVSEGFELINKHPCGSLGYMSKGKWTKEKCFEEARKYTKRSEFQRNASQAYSIAFTNGWIDEMDWMKKRESVPKGFWKSKENIENEAKKYKTIKEFMEGNPTAYSKACKYGYLNDLTWLDKEKRLPFGYWKDKEHVIEEGKKYKSKKEFQENNQSAYGAAMKYGYIDEMPWLCVNKVTKRGLLKNKEYIMNEAKKYKRKVDFMRGNKSVYGAACRYGFIKEMDWFETKGKEKKEEDDKT